MREKALLRLETSALHINELTSDIRRGDIKVPRFQRQYVWSNIQAFDLLDSIVNNYPIGSFLLWRTNEKLVAERNVGNFRLPQTAEMKPTNYVLDGQQRLTVIYSCLGATPEDQGFTAGYDLKSGGFVPLTGQSAFTIFPLRVLFRTDAVMSFRTKLNSYKHAKKLQDNLDKLISTFDSYKIPVVTLIGLTVDEVCPIFERINSSGTRLSIYDLMVSATWSARFDLNAAIDEICLTLEKKGFGDIERDTVLKCLSAIQVRSIKRSDILGLRHLRGQEVKTLVKKGKEVLLRAVDLLSTEFLVYSWDFVPFEGFVFILSALYATANVLNPDQVKRARRWFWRSAFSGRYRGADEATICRDIPLVCNYVINGDGTPNVFGKPPSLPKLKAIDFSSNASLCRAFILMLATLRPRNITNGAHIDISDALSSFNKKQFHHIFPKAFLRRTKASGNHNSLANICLLAASENRSVSDDAPHSYLLRCVNQLGEEGPGVFQSNLLPGLQDIDYSQVAYDQFLNIRGSMILKVIQKLCDGS